jgi:hypothetical protein
MVANLREVYEITKDEHTEQNPTKSKHHLELSPMPGIRFVFLIFGF